MSAPISRRFLHHFVAVACLAAQSSAGGVRIIERPSVPPFVSIQGAVDAALDGETVLVGQGTYPPFTVTAKSVSVMAEGTGLVTVNGTVIVKDLPSTGTVLLLGFTINGVSGFNNAPPGLELTNNAGHVRVQGCVIRGALFSGDEPKAGAGVEIDDCPKVAFVGCTITGGSHSGFCAGCTGDAGGNGITAINGGVSLYDCTLQGGNGTSESNPGGDGGHGYLADSWGVVASGCTIIGGNGGAGDYVGCPPAGWGGDGIRLLGSQAHLLDNGIAGGAPGNWACGGPAPQPGQAINNQSSFVDLLAGTRRKLTVPAFASDHAPLDATVNGEAGDKVYAFMARGPFFLFLQAFNGTWLVPYYGFLVKQPLIVLPASGPNSVTIPLPDLQVPDVGEPLFVQVLAIDVTGKKFLSSPQHVLLLNRDALPDCNGNGVLDFIDTIAGLGSVPDTNNDFIPDGCAGLPTTHWVDASAPPGGDGSSAFPFQNIRAGIDVSLSGHTVIVRDGLYSGPLNRNNDFGGRNLIVKSENGAASCVIDCQDAGRAFMVKNPATLAARIQGFTIRNGRSDTTQGGAIDAHSVTVWDCAFEDCRIGTATGSGGAIYARLLDLRRSVFRANYAGATGATGGAVFLYGSGIGPLSFIQRCAFENNTAGSGGAIGINSWADVVVSHCRFVSNVASVRGGAIWQWASSFSQPGGLRVDDCLFAGNSSSMHGGAIAAGTPFISAYTVWITGSTFTGNSCVNGYGGALSLQNNVNSLVANCILWGDSAGLAGPELSLRYGGSNVSVNWSDVQGGLAGVDWTAGTLTWGAGNLDLDPQFSDPDGPDNDPLTFFDNDYTLSLASPCIDAADNVSIPADLTDIDGDGNTSEPVPLDLLLSARRVDVPSVPDTGTGSPPIVDMGPYERP